MDHAHHSTISTLPPALSSTSSHSSRLPLYRQLQHTMHHQDGTARLEWKTPSSLQYADSSHLPGAMTCLITDFPGEPIRGTTPEVFDSIDELVIRTDGLFGTKVGLSKDFRVSQGREFVWTTMTDDEGVSTTYLGKHYKTGGSGYLHRCLRTHD